MAKSFFRQNPITKVWEYGTFKQDGITPKVELTAPAGQYRSRWETINNIVCLSIINANNSEELDPFGEIPITDVASDLTGTPYANRAEFEAATKDFFFKQCGIASDGFLYLPNSFNGLRVRIGQRSGWTWAVDKELTALGFDGVENTDWINVDGAEGDVWASAFSILTTDNGNIIQSGSGALIDN